MIGYQIIEPESISYNISGMEEMGELVSKLYLVAETLNRDDQLKGEIRIDVIKVSYLGNYPALGLIDLNNSNKDFEEVIQEKAKEILDNLSPEQLHEFRLEHIIGIEEIMKTL